MGYVIDTDQVRATGKQVLSDSTSIASDSTTLASKVEALVSGTGLNSPAGMALHDTVGRLRKAVAKLTEAMNGLSTNMGVAATNHDSADAGAAAALTVQ